jgi:hypothetical protein
MVCYMNINFPIKSLYPLKKPHQSALGTFKDLSIYRGRQAAGSDFVLYYVMMMMMVIIYYDVAFRCLTFFNKYSDAGGRLRCI